jgi:hypothetical protein
MTPTLRDRHLHGLDALLGAEPETSKAILIRVKNAGELARGQGGVASFAQAIAPSMIESKVLDEMAKQFSKSLAEKHVVADVTIVEPNGWKAANSSHIWSDVGYAVGGAGILMGLWFAFSAHRGAK